MIDDCAFVYLTLASANSKSKLEMEVKVKSCACRREVQPGWRRRAPVAHSPAGESNCFIVFHSLG